MPIMQQYMAYCRDPKFQTGEYHVWRGSDAAPRALGGHSTGCACKDGVRWTVRGIPASATCNQFLTLTLKPSSYLTVSNGT